MGVLLAFLLTLSGLATAQAEAPVDHPHCHADILERTRSTAQLDLRNTSDGVCRLLTSHRCGREIRVRRVTVIRAPHRFLIEIECGDPLRLRDLRVEEL
jgi:hypothetical protein